MSIAGKISSHNRTRKYNRFLAEFCISEGTRTLDVGFSEKEYSPVDNFIERNYPYPRMLTALGVELPVQFAKRYPEVNVIQYDGWTFPFSDKSFDICWSNAVIEHVGDFDRQAHFLKEICRVSESFFITTPNRYFPIEVHTRIPFLHWLPKRTFDRLLPALGKEWAAGNYMHLLGLTDIRRLCSEAGITGYRVWANRLMGFVMDYVIIHKANERT